MISRRLKIEEAEKLILPDVFVNGDILYAKNKTIVEFEKKIEEAEKNLERLRSRLDYEVAEAKKSQLINAIICAAEVGACIEAGIYSGRSRIDRIRNVTHLSERMEKAVAEMKYQFTKRRKKAQVVQEMNNDEPLAACIVECVV